MIIRTADFNESAWLCVANEMVSMVKQSRQVIAFCCHFMTAHMQPRYDFTISYAYIGRRTHSIAGYNVASSWFRSSRYYYFMSHAVQFWLEGLLTYREWMKSKWFFLQLVIRSVSGDIKAKPLPFQKSNPFPDHRSRSVPMIKFSKSTHCATHIETHIWCRPTRQWIRKACKILIDMTLR